MEFPRAPPPRPFRTEACAVTIPTAEGMGCGLGKIFCGFAERAFGPFPVLRMPQLPLSGLALSLTEQLPLAAGRSQQVPEGSPAFRPLPVLPPSSLSLQTLDILFASWLSSFSSS